MAIFIKNLFGVDSLLSSPLNPSPLPSEPGISVADMLPLRGARLVRKSFHDLFFSRRQPAAAEGRRAAGRLAAAAAASPIAIPESGATAAYKT